MAMGADDCEIVVGQMGSLAMPLVVAQCSVFDGLSAEEPYADFTHSMRLMINPNGVYVKPRSVEKVGIGLGPKQLKPILFIS